MNLHSIFANVSGGSFVGIDTTTDVALTGGKANPMQGRVTKVMRGASVMVFQNKYVNAYQEIINRRLVAEGKIGDFEVGARAWGNRVPNLPIVEHNGKEYLEVIFLRAGDVEYFLDGNPIAKNSIVGLKDGGAGEQGGLDNKVIIRTYAVESINCIRIDGQAYY